MEFVGAVAAFASSLTWAFASVRYSQHSRELGSTGVNLARAIVVSPFFVLIGLAFHGRNLLDVRATSFGWLALSVVGSYALADNLFFSAARRVGVSTALSIASTYPIWAVLVGVARGERFGVWRGFGTMLCVVGVATLIRLAPRTAADDGTRSNVSGVLLAAVTSLLWAVNSVSVNIGAVGLDVSQVNAIRYSIALVVLAVIARSTRTGRLPRRRDWRTLIPAIVADGVFGSSFYVYGLAHSDLAVGATLTSLAPLISVPLAIAMGEEKWSAPRLAAVTATVIGAVLLVSSA